MNGNLPPFIDLITARTEFYTHPTALPTVEQGSIKLDLHRRDFTINTLALRLDGHHYGELHDYWGGLNDLRQGQVRCLHSLSFVDDPTRMLRAVRFEQRFGFSIEQRTLQLLHEAQALLDRVSGDRIRHELDHILDEERAAPMLARLNQLNLLSTTLPGLEWDAWLYQRVDELVTQKVALDWEVWSEHGVPSGEKLWNGMPRQRVLAYTLLLLRQPVERAREVLVRLKAPHSLVEVVLSACALWQDLPSFVGELISRIVARLDEAPPLALAAVFFAASDPLPKDLLLKYMNNWRKVMPSITGYDLRQLGLPPGPQYARILAALRTAWLDGEIRSQEEEKELLNRLMREM